MAWVYVNLTNGMQSDAAQPNSLAQDIKNWGGDVNANLYQLKSLGTPTDPEDAATKDYVDTTASGKQDVITGAASTIATVDLDPDIVVITDGDGKIAESAVTATELGYLSGVSSAIQTQIDSKVTGPAMVVDDRIVTFDGTTGKLVQDSGKLLPSGAVVGDTDTQTLTGKAIDADNNTVTNIGSSEVKSELVTGLTAKSTPIGADLLLISDSEDGGALKKIEIDDLPGGGGGGAIEIETAGTPVASADTLDLYGGSGVVRTVTDEGGGVVSDSIAVDSAVVAFRAQVQAGTDLLVVPTSADPVDYEAALTPTLTAYTTGQVLHFSPDVTNTGAATLDIDILGAKAIKMADGTTDPPASALVAGQLYPIWYDGTVFRIVDEAGTTVAPDIPRTISILNPTNEDVTLLTTRAAMRIIEVIAVVRGSGSPEVNFDLLIGADRSASGTEVVTGGFTADNTTTGTSTTTFDFDEMDVGDHLWIKVTGTSGTVDEVSVTVYVGAN